MNKSEEIQKRYEIGFPVFKRLFEMDSKSLKEILLKICASHTEKDVIEHGSVFKTIINDEPDSIEIIYYSSNFKVSPFGIFYKPENGGGTPVIEFNEFFNYEKIPDLKSAIYSTEDVKNKIKNLIKTAEFIEFTKDYGITGWKELDKWFDAHLK